MEPPRTEEVVPVNVEGDGDGRPPSVFAQQQRHVVTLKFEDVVYKIKTKGPGGKETERTILKGVSGVVLPGEMLALMGPSGGGKTTLLTALGGRIDGARDRLTGSITYNGRPFSNSFRRNLGFVTQDDVLYPHLTVSETLLYTALLRLPSALSRAEKASQAEAVMSQLGLVACRNSIIGGPLIRGVSGGERKRVSIGQEMLINPSLLFLDEPTSGLDSTTAARIVSTLRELAQGGRTVVMTIHQPSSRLFYMFNKVLLLCEGNPVYYGKASDAMAYFASVGYAPSVAMNPADFILDLANGVTSDETVLDNATSVKEAIVSAYNIRLRNQVSEETRDVDKQLQETDLDRKTTQWCTTWCDQFKVLLERDLKERKHESFSSLKIAQVIISAVLAGLLWFQSQGRVQDQVGLMFFIDGFWAFFPLYNAIFTFPQERSMLTKERMSGMYRLSSYFFARMAGDLPMELVLPVVFLNIAYWMAGLKSTAGSYFAYLFVTLMHVLVAQGLGLALGALVMELKAATTLGAVLMLVVMLTGGFYVEHMPSFIAWVKYVSFIFYTFKLQIASQYSPSDTYECAPELRCKVVDFPAIKVTGFEHRGAAAFALFLLLVLFRLAAYLGLRRVGVKR